MLGILHSSSALTDESRKEDILLYFLMKDGSTSTDALRPSPKLIYIAQGSSVRKKVEEKCCKFW